MPRRKGLRQAVDFANDQAEKVVLLLRRQKIEPWSPGEFQFSPQSFATARVVFH